MNFISFLFAVIGAALNLFQSVVSSPDFSGSMYNACVALFENISKNGLPGGDGSAIGAILIFVVLLMPLAP